MRIAIDASRAVNETAGIGRYTLELLKKIVEIDRKNQYLLFFTFMRSDSRKEKIVNDFQKAKNVQVKTFKIPGSLKEKIWGWRMPWFKYLLAGADLFYAPSFFEVNLGLKIPQVVTIYDLTTFLFPEHRGVEVSQRLNERAEKACQKAAKIIAISRSTQKDLEKYLKIKPTKIKVIYPGQNILPKSTGALPYFLKNQSYILTVGTIEPRKNLVGLLKAYAILPRRLQEKYLLVVAGATGWNTAEISDISDHLKIKDRVKFLGFITDNKLAKLYEKAAVFCYPSLYEGFGFPVLEALSFGLPVLTSNLSSLPEVAGKAAILIDPQDSNVISSGLQKLLEHQDERESLKKLAKIQAQKFSWEKTAKETLKLFKEVVNG